MKAIVLVVFALASVFSLYADEGKTLNELASEQIAETLFKGRKGRVIANGSIKSSTESTVTARQEENGTQKVVVTTHQEEEMEGYLQQRSTAKFKSKVVAGSKDTPVKSITIDLYLDTELEQEQMQAQVAEMIMKLKQLQAQKAKAKTNYELRIRSE